MSMTFQDFYPVEKVAKWMTLPFSGFCLDSRKVKAGQIYIALNSFSQPENDAVCTVSFDQRCFSGGQ